VPVFAECGGREILFRIEFDEAGQGLEAQPAQQLQRSQIELYVMRAISAAGQGFQL
jgi:hypothetical protein